MVRLCDVSQFVGTQVSRRTPVVSARPWLFGSTNLGYERVKSEEKAKRGGNAYVLLRTRLARLGGS